MKIKKLVIRKYRNYDNLEIKFNENLNIIIGNNAQGKTNLLESIYVLSVTKSFLSIIDKSIIKFDNKALLVKGNISTSKENKTLEVIITDKGKKVKINSREIKKLSDYISNFNVIIFCSDSIRIFKDSPTSRRKYFNIQISQINKKYLNIMNEYNNILKQRNEYLKRINLNSIDNIYLNILNDHYADLSLEIYNYRRKYIEDINKYLTDEYNKISNLNGIKLKYVSNIAQLSKEQIIKKLESNLSREIQLGMTLIGPNKDDFYFEYDNKNLLMFGSQGQIRCAILALKLSEVKIFNSIKNDNPVLLLDDIFSELDINKRNNILNNIDSDVQVIMTTTDIENINNEIRKKANVYEIEKGKIISQEIILKQEGDKNE